MDSHDHLHIANEKSVTKTFENGENILLSTQIFKFNDEGKRQTRSLLITTQNIYNLSKTSIKRKIPIKKVGALTCFRLIDQFLVSSTGMEFIIHVPEEYDYRYASYDRRDSILLTILSARGGQLMVFFKEEVNLIPYLTTKADKKKGISRIPTTGGEKMNEDAFRNRVKSETDERQLQKERTSTLYSENQQKVCIDDFNLINVLGRGAYGKVMLVEKKDSKEIFAMKSIRKQDILDEETLQHTKTEKQVLGHVNHPFLVNLKYSFQTPEKIFFVTQFMKGGELFQHLKQVKRFDEQRARFYCAEIALALEHLHSKNIIYRDLKPENVLMDELGHVCLTDFGMAKILRKNELAMSFCGTPEYLAPEILKEIGHSLAADWWALGIFTYEMMFALPPFYNKNQDLMFKQIQTANIVFPSLPAISNEAKDFITKLLIKEPASRLGSQKGSQEIKAHPWFAGIDWVKLLNKEIQPPFKPTIQGDNWLENFDKQFTKENAINSYTEPTNLNQEDFKEF